MQKLYIHQPDETVIYEMWEDIAGVTVPARSHRSTIIGKALQQAGIMPTADSPLRLRVLDARCATVTEVGLKVTEPELEFRT